MKFFIIAGEPSGDQHGGLLMEALSALKPGIRFSGIGGETMRRAGLESLIPLDQMAVMGFVEVIRHLFFFRRVKAMVLDHINKTKPDRVILIDYPGFNLRLASQIKRRFHIPVTYYISPQLWAWKAKRVERIREAVDQLLVIFPFEVDWYRQRGVTARFVGHPFLDEWQPREQNDLCSRMGLDSSRPVLTLFPGSRRQELKRHLSIFLNAARLVQKRLAAVQIILGLAPQLAGGKLLDGYDLTGIKVIRENSRLALEAADSAIVASGTSTLEGAIFGTPMAVIYRMSPISWWLTRAFVKVSFAGMANILANDKIVPEFLQNEARPSLIAAEIIRQLTDKPYAGVMKAKLGKVREALGGKGASSRAAQAILEHQSIAEPTKHEK